MTQYHKIVLMAGFVLAVVLTVSCVKKNYSNSSNSTHAETSFKGTDFKNYGSVIFNSYQPLSSKPIEVYYNIPANGDRSTMPIIFVMHGINRNGLDYLNAWVKASNEKGFMVFAPEFGTNYYTGSSYNYGGIFNGRTLNPEAEWTFSMIEPLFDFVVSKLGSNQKNYDIWGHSAGCQFVHRYVLYKPNARLNRAMAANCGEWTVPDFNVAFPYGLGSSPATSSSLGAAFAQHLVVQLGTADTDPNHQYLGHNANSDLQGKTRYDRGKYFWNVANTKKRDYPTFRWEKREVAGIAHNYDKMAIDAAIYLYPVAASAKETPATPAKKTPPATTKETPATSAEESNSSMYCVIYMKGKVTTCTEYKDTDKNKSTCNTRNNNLKIIKGSAVWTSTKPSVKCGKD